MGLVRVLDVSIDGRLTIIFQVVLAEAFSIFILVLNIIHRQDINFCL